MIEGRTFKGDLAKLIRYAVARTRRPSMLPYHGINVPVGATPELGSLTRRILRGLHERFEIAAVEALVRPEDIVLEVGAGTGVLSAIVARLGAEVHAFEANPSLIPSAQAVFSANRVSVDYRTAAIGLQAGQARFFTSRSGSGEGGSLIDRDTDMVIDVPTVAFSDVLEEIRPSFVAMDAEGAERDLLAKALPQTVRALTVEIHPHIIGDDTASALVHDILSQGFTLMIDQSGFRTFAFSRPAPSRPARQVCDRAPHAAPRPRRARS